MTTQVPHLQWDAEGLTLTLGLASPGRGSFEAEGGCPFPARHRWPSSLPQAWWRVAPLCRQAAGGPRRGQRGHTSPQVPTGQCEKLTGPSLGVFGSHGHHPGSLQGRPRGLVRPTAQGTRGGSKGKNWGLTWPRAFWIKHLAIV